MGSDEVIGNYTSEITIQEPRMKNWYFSLTKTGGLYILIKAIMPDLALKVKDNIYGKDTYIYMWSEAEWNREVVRNYSVKLFKELNTINPEQ